MISKTNAIVLRISPFSMTSHVVTWLTEDGTLVRTAVKGATRNKSAFLGQYDLFYTCELLYYTRSYGEVHTAKECTPLKLREPFRENWRTAQCASWFASLIYHTAEAYHKTKEVYTLLDETLDLLSIQKTPHPVLFARLETKLLDEIGLFPNFGECGSCAFEERDTRKKKPGSLRFNIAEGCIHCPEHHHISGYTPIVTISNDVVDLMNTIVRSTSLGPQSSILKTPEPTVFALLRFLGLFIRYHIYPLPIEGRAIALNALRV